MRAIRSLLVTCALVATLAPAALGALPVRPAPPPRPPLATGRPLVVRFFTLLQRKNVAGLRRFLSPAFQLQRADGSSAGKAQFLKKLPVVLSFKLSGFAATEANLTLVVRYLATVKGSVNGKPYTPGPAPRLTVFTWNGRGWQLIAHSNFNPLTG